MARLQSVVTQHAANAESQPCAPAAALYTLYICIYRVVYKALSSLSRAGFTGAHHGKRVAMQPNALQYRYCPIDEAMTISVVSPFYALQSLTHLFADTV